MNKSLIIRVRKRVGGRFEINPPISFKLLALLIKHLGKKKKTLFFLKKNKIKKQIINLVVSQKRRGKRKFITSTDKVESKNKSARKERKGKEKKRKSSFSSILLSDLNFPFFWSNKNKLMFRFEQEKMRKRISISFSFWFWFPFSGNWNLPPLLFSFWFLVFLEEMADAVITAAVLRNLSDKLYEKRKNAALEVSLSLSLSNMCLSNKILSF